VRYDDMVYWSVMKSGKTTVIPCRTAAGAGKGPVSEGSYSIIGL